MKKSKIHDFQAGDKVEIMEGCKKRLTRNWKDFSRDASYKVEGIAGLTLLWIVDSNGRRWTISVNEIVKKVDAPLTFAQLSLDACRLAFKAELMTLYLKLKAIPEVADEAQDIAYRAIRKKADASGFDNVVVCHGATTAIIWLANNPDASPAVRKEAEADIKRLIIYKEEWAKGEAGKTKTI